MYIFTDRLALLGSRAWKPCDSTLFGRTWEQELARRLNFTERAIVEHYWGMTREP
jgi:hypothetical protein